MRFNVAVFGRPQSVASTGFQTTKMRMRLPASCCKVRSVAEDPCKQIGQVGDNSSSTRASSAAALNEFLIADTFCGVRLWSGAWPGGTCPAPCK